MSQTDEFIDEIRREFPRFRLVYKHDDPLSHVIDTLLKALTLGGMREYMTHYHTVIFDTLYVPSCWDETDDTSRVITLRHERVHLRQTRRYGAIGMTFIYLLPFFPLFFAYGRARIEWEAYAETVRATAELRGLEAAKSEGLRRHIVKQFTSASYGWMWPFEKQVGRWYDVLIAEIEAEFSAR